MKHILKTITWQLLGLAYFIPAGYLLGTELIESFLLWAGSVPVGSLMYYSHEWIWSKVNGKKLH